MIEVGHIRVSNTGVLGHDAIDVEDLTRAEVTLRRNALRTVEFLRARVPGYERRFLVDLASPIGTLDSRRVVGDYPLTLEDLTAGAAFADGVGRICQNRCFQATCDVPCRCLLPRGAESLLVAGRPVAAEPRVHEVTRLIPPALVTGQAAGAAAALAVADGVSPRSVDMPRLRALLASQGVPLAFAAGTTGG